MRFILFLSITLSSFTLTANDPYEQLNYKLAFDLSKVQAKHKGLMHALGCDQNVFDETAEGSAENDLDLEKAWQAYEEDCLKHLAETRRAVIFRPVRMSMIGIGFQAVALGLVAPFIGAESMGGSFGLLSAGYTGAQFLTTMAEAVYNFYYAPAHTLDALEIKFVKNQCFIPKKIWSIIEAKFMEARSNQFQQRQALSYLEFALDFTTESPSVLEETLTLEEAQKELLHRINLFFEDYDLEDDTPIQLIKKNILNFIARLYGENENTRYLYLIGSGGIGKTYFATQLTAWLNELCPDAVYMEKDLVVNSEMELDDLPGQPGIFLRILRNQCLSERKGSLLFFDEADWMAHGGATAKRIFNEKQNTIETSYFGKNEDGTNLQLKAPHMLVMLASNKEIDDPALKSRFDVIDFPTPRKEAFEKVACQIVESSSWVKGHKKEMLTKRGHLKNDLIVQIREAIAGDQNFREVEASIGLLLQQLREKSWGLSRSAQRTEKAETSLKKNTETKD